MSTDVLVTLSLCHRSVTLSSLHWCPNHIRWVSKSPLAKINGVTDELFLKAEMQDWNETLAWDGPLRSLSRWLVSEEQVDKFQSFAFFSSAALSSWRRFQLLYTCIPQRNITFLIQVDKDVLLFHNVSHDFFFFLSCTALFQWSQVEGELTMSHWEISSRIFLKSSYLYLQST